MHYDRGQEVTLRLGDRALKGRISDITLTSAQLTFPVTYTLSGNGTLVWPDGFVETLNLDLVAPNAALNLKLPYPERRKTKRNLNPLESEKDHRRTIRIDCSVAVRVADFTGTRRLMDAKTLNVSSGGALIHCEAPLIVGRDYTLKIELPDEAMALKARVVRRLGHNTFAFRFLADAETGHILMRRVFLMLRGNEPASTRRSSWNFRKN